MTDTSALRAFIEALLLALKAEARGWGPDFTEITLTCPDKRCTWAHTYDDIVTIGEMVEQVAAHEHRYLPKADGSVVPQV